MTTFLHRIARTGPAAPAAKMPGPEPVVTKDALVDVVLQAVANVDWTQPGVDGRLGRTRTARAEVLLATLTYCYASGLYNSGNIEAAILRNRHNTELLNRMPLDRRSFSRFRRFHRDLLTDCLTEVLGRGDEAARRIERAIETDFIETEE